MLRLGPGSPGRPSNTNRAAQDILYLYSTTSSAGLPLSLVR